MDYLADLRAAIEDARRHGVTLTAIAEAAGANRATVAHQIAGRRGITLEHAQKLRAVAKSLAANN